MDTMQDHRLAPRGTPLGTLSRNPGAGSGIATRVQFSKLRRTLVLAATSLASSVGIGLGVGAITGSRRAGLIAGGAAALSALAFRFQLQRLFTDEPAFTVEKRIGDLEIRHYAPRVEAHTRFATLEFDAVREKGFQRLASYIFGANSMHQDLAMTAPVTIAPRGASHTVAFVMPPDRTLDSLPQPDDSRVTLVEVPARRFAVLRYIGRYNAESFEAASRKMRELATEAHLTALGEPMFAGFDPPTTLPFLRRTEIWLELA